MALRLRLLLFDIVILWYGEPKSDAIFQRMRIKKLVSISKQMLRRLLDSARLFLESNHGGSVTKLGRWSRFDNTDIKATLANIDSCGDRLCGDVRETKLVIDKYQRASDDHMKRVNVESVLRVAR